MSTEPDTTEPEPNLVLGGILLLIIVAVVIGLLVLGFQALFGDDEDEYVPVDSGTIHEEPDSYDQPAFEPAEPARPGTGKYSHEECLAFRADILDDSKSEWDRSDSVGKYTVHCQGS